MTRDWILFLKIYMKMNAWGIKKITCHCLSPISVSGSASTPLIVFVDQFVWS